MVKANQIGKLIGGFIVVKKNTDVIGLEVSKIIEEVKKELGVDNKGLAKLLEKDEDFLNGKLNPKYVHGISIDELVEILDLIGKKLVLEMKK